MTLRYGALIGPAIEAMRRARGWTRTEYGRISGVGASRVWRYETGRKVPDLDTVSRMLEPLDADVCVIPLVTARTLSEREDLITAIRAWRRGESDGDGWAAVNAAMSALNTAERNLTDLPDSPYEVIRDLREDLAARDREIARLRAAVRSATELLIEVTR